MSERPEHSAERGDLTRAINASGLKRTWLAEQLGISRQTLHRWEHGASSVPADMQERIAALIPEHTALSGDEEVLLDAAA